MLSKQVRQHVTFRDVVCVKLRTGLNKPACTNSVSRCSWRGAGRPRIVREAKEMGRGLPEAFFTVEHMSQLPDGKKKALCV